MGSDSSPHVLFEAVLQAAGQLDATHCLLVIATHAVVEDLARLQSADHLSGKSARIEFQLVSEVISMRDEPLSAIRLKKGSSLVTGIRLLKKHSIDAFVSAGNTGALVAAASLQLRMLPGTNRPALLATLPTQTGSVAVVDVGGNVSCKAHHLVQFAHMGAAYQRCSKGIETPRVGLLNIGVESKKGHAEVRQAWQVLKEQAELVAANGMTPRMHFVGNIEGREVFNGNVDVLVTDGFTGNVLLKTSEGTASFIFDFMQQTLKNEKSEQLKVAMKDIQRFFSYDEYPGAIICGVDGIVVKCHGNASAKALLSCIHGAVTLINKQLLNKIKEQLL